MFCFETFYLEPDADSTSVSLLLRGRPDHPAPPGGLAAVIHQDLQGGEDGQGEDGGEHDESPVIGRQPLYLFFFSHLCFHDWNLALDIFICYFIKAPGNLSFFFCSSQCWNKIQTRKFQHNEKINCQNHKNRVRNNFCSNPQKSWTEWTIQLIQLLVWLKFD